jgi:hypothetical protein
MKHTRKNRKRNRKSRRGGGLFGPSASDKYVDELLANLNNGKLEDILIKLPKYSEESILSKLKQKAQGQNVDNVIVRIKDIMAERDTGEFGERY